MAIQMVESFKPRTKSFVRLQMGTKADGLDGGRTGRSTKVGKHPSPHYPYKGCEQVILVIRRPGHNRFLLKLLTRLSCLSMWVQSFKQFLPNISYIIMLFFNFSSLLLLTCQFFYPIVKFFFWFKLREYLLNDLH